MMHYINLVDRLLPFSANIVIGGLQVNAFDQIFAFIYNTIRQ